MNTCHFCKRDFPSPQSFYAHLRRCADYLNHKQERNAALGTSLRQAVPKARPDQATSPPIPLTPPLQPNDPFAPFMDLLRGYGVPPPTVNGPQETLQERRRRLLQDAKIRAVDRYWSFAGTLTSEMRASAKLAIDRELRNEPLEEFSPQEVIELAEGIRDRVYSSFLRRQEKQARQTQVEKERKRANERDDERRQRERTKKRAAILDEARRRAVTFLKTRSLSPLKRLQALEEILSLLDDTLTGDEPVSEAYAALEAILGVRTAELKAQEAAKEARQQREWQELGTVVVAVLALWFTYTKGDEILQWLIKILSSMPAEGPGRPQNSTTKAAPQTSDHPTPRRPIRRMRRPPQSPPPSPPSSSSEQESENPFL